LIPKEVPQDVEQRKPTSSLVKNEVPIEQPIEMEHLPKVEMHKDMPLMRTRLSQP
jgi:hypothetical protein